MPEKLPASILIPTRRPGSYLDVTPQSVIGQAADVDAKVIDRQARHREAHWA